MCRMLGLFSRACPQSLAPQTKGVGFTLITQLLLIGIGVTECSNFNDIKKTICFAGSAHRDLRRRRLWDHQEFQPRHQRAPLCGLPAGHPKCHPAAAAVLPSGCSPRLRCRCPVPQFFWFKPLDVTDAREVCLAKPMALFHWGDGSVTVRYHFNVGGGQRSLNLLSIDNSQVY